MPDVLLIATDHLIEIPELSDGLSGAPIDNAVVHVTLTDRDGSEIAGASWPLSIPPVAGRAGAYRATLPYALALTHGQRLVAQVVADAGAGLHREWSIPLVARVGT